MDNIGDEKLEVSSNGNQNLITEFVSIITRLLFSQ